MKILLAPDSFKGCLTSLEICTAISKGILKANSNIEIMQFPSSDGGEGFCDCMQNIFGGTFIEREVTYPLGNKGSASFLYVNATHTAYIELAAAAGLSLVPNEQRSILSVSTYGVGELIIEAVTLGAKNIVIGLGGSATNDCGIGMLAALGMRFYDKDSRLLKPIAASLGKVVYADKTEMIDITKIKFTAACDVNNPLCGKNGAAEVFSRQKGATETDVILLDDYAHTFAVALGIDPNLPGSGAAGGVGAAMLSVLNAKYVSGASLLVGSKAFNRALEITDLLITGEGNTDAQTAHGKLVSVVARAAKKANIPVVVISGGLSEGYQLLYDCGVSQFYSLMDECNDIQYCINNASELLEEKAKKVTNDYLKDINKSYL